MPRKINQRKEKRERNEIYAKRFENKDVTKKQKLGIGKAWCRISFRGVTHPLDCSCNLPTREELIALSRRK